MHRPPAWRWHLAGELLQAGKKPGRRMDHRGVSAVFQFRQALEAAVDEDDHLALHLRFPDLYSAWSLFDDELMRPSRSELEARLLTDEPYHRVAQKLAVPESVVAAYEASFFHVKDRLQATSYITHVVFGPILHLSFSERNYELLWKLVAYWCGTAALEHVVTKFNQPQKPDSAAGVDILWGNIAASNMRMKMALAALTMPVTPMSVPDIISFHFQQTAAEQAAGTTGSTHEQVLENIRVMWQSLPFHRIVDANDHQLVGATGITVRAIEQLMLEGPQLAEVEQQNDGAVFPRLKIRSLENSNE